MTEHLSHNKHGDPLPDERSPHYYIEVESEADTTSRVYDLNDAAEPIVFGPCTYQEAREWCIAHGDPEAAE